jgi:hypothetical protein
VLFTLLVLFLRVTFLIVAIAFYSDLTCPCSYGDPTIFNRVAISALVITPADFYASLAIISIVDGLSGSPVPFETVII